MPWFSCPGCDRIVTGLVRSDGPKHRDSYSSTHCCFECERGEGHNPEDWRCAGLPQTYFREVSISDALPPAHYLVHAPDCKYEMPVVLFLHGGLTYIYPESLWWDFRDLIDKNRVVKERFVLIAPFGTMDEPLAVVSGMRQKEDRFGNTVGYADEFDEHLVWETLQQACRALGPGRADLSRLSVIGYSMGGQAVWNLMLRYGSRLAAAVPFAGCCTWRNFDWSQEADVNKELQHIAIRSYNGLADRQTYNWRDFAWIANKRSGSWNDPAEKIESHAENIRLTIYKWSEQIQLCLVEGTVTSHCCWDVVFYNEESFNLFSWLETCRITPDVGEPQAMQLDRTIDVNKPSDS